MIRFCLKLLHWLKYLLISSFWDYILAAMFSRTALQILVPVKSFAYHRTYVNTWKAINVYSDRRARMKTYLALTVLLYYAFANLFFAFLPDLESSRSRLLVFDSWFTLMPKKATNVMAFFVCLQLVYFIRFIYLNDSRHMFSIVNDVLLEGKVGCHFSGRYYSRFGLKIPIVKLLRTWYLVSINSLQLFTLLTCK